ncbi:class I SAM-dependent methyltransferase [Cysteiniphilum halobium]|uniref:class I SAM-dependent methyltransferase n=1 Tax=Cysteiniphilum halobium TaxID=2219059 RepID=UPI003F833E22
MQTVYYLKSNNSNQLLDLSIPESINLKILNTLPEHCFYLKHEENLLVLKHSSSILTLCVDFNSHEIQNRIKPNTAKLDLIKAVEGKNKAILSVLDMTAGLGQDSFSLAARGHIIDAIEQNIYVFLLLQDGLRRAKEDPNLTTIANSIRLYFANSITFNHTQHTQKYDVIYLDPMFPERTKSAKVKKNMQLLHELVGIDDNNNQLLLKQAKALKPKKIIVKRPRLGNFIDNNKPTSQVIGKSSRFDVYAY